MKILDSFFINYGVIWTLSLGVFGQDTEVSENRRYSYRRKVETFKVQRWSKRGRFPLILYVFEVQPSLKFADLSLQKGLRFAPDTLPFVETLAFWWEPKRGAAIAGIRPEEVQW